MSRMTSEDVVVMIVMVVMVLMVVVVVMEMVEMVEMVDEGEVGMVMMMTTHRSTWGQDCQVSRSLHSSWARIS